MHHGIMHVPHGYGFAGTSKLDEVKGGSAWGAFHDHPSEPLFVMSLGLTHLFLLFPASRSSGGGTLAGADGSRQPSVAELEEVAHHAKHFVSVVAQFKR